MKGKGSLAKLERLKAEYGSRFREAAPKRRRVDQECLDLLCPYAIGRIGLSKDRRLHIKKEWCTRKQCRKKGDDTK